MQSPLLPSWLRRTILFFGFSGLFCFSSGLSHAQADLGFSVQTKIAPGAIEGIYDTRTGVQRYLGIPYAQPPVGALRWKAPQPPASWQGVKQAKNFGPRAVQAFSFDDMVFRSQGMSEDCLYLNVWTPAKVKTKDLPVLVYFYGGGFVAGDGSEPRYDGASMAANGIVVVTVNYRLNIFGFFSHPSLTAESPHHASGNYGLLDQSAALQWVRDNIAAFGGDPKRVTIAGESAGSISVSLQMASPLSRNLIAGAIGESGSGLGNTLTPVPLAEAEKTGVDFARKAGDLSLEQLRALSTRELWELYQGSGRWGFPIAIDGYFLPKSALEIFSAGEQSKVPLLVGWNSAEIPGLAFIQGPYSEKAYVEKVKATYPSDFEEVLRLYPAGETVERSSTDLGSDRFIAYGTWKWFDAHRKTSGQSTYRYVYSRIPPVPPTKPSRKPAPFVMPPLIGAPHACEIPYFLGNLELVTNLAYSADDYAVAAATQAYVANFIKTGNPNGSGVPEWPAASAQDVAPAVMDLDVRPKAAPSTVEARYQFHDRQPAQAR